MMLASSDITREVNRALLLLGGISLVLLVGITLVMILFAVRYRRSRTRTTTQIEGNKWLEVLWILIPTVIVTWMFFIGYKGFLMMREVPEGAMVVEVTGKQWMWAFRYPEEKLDTTELVVPVNKPVRVELTAPPNDVVHSFYIPDFRVKEDVVPGKTTHLWFESERTGVFNIFCAEFCGKDHSKMLSILRVVSQSDYDQWIGKQRARRYQPLVFEATVDPNHADFGADKLNIDAKRLYGTFCASCHGETGDGSGLPGVARNFGNPDGWKRSRKVVDIYRTLTDGVDGSQMRSYPNLTPWERIALAHVVRSYSSETLVPDSQEDFAELVRDYELDKVKTPGDTISIDRAMEILSTEGRTSAIQGQDALSSHHAAAPQSPGS